MKPKHQDWLLELTSLPTAAGRERSVIQWVQRWAKQRPSVQLRRDRFGNLLLKRRGMAGRGSGGSQRPIYFTAHMDHPAFVVTKQLDRHTVEADFRGGVADHYFLQSPVWLHRDGKKPQRGKVTALHGATKKRPDKRAVVRFSQAVNAEAGDVMTWGVGRPRIKGGRLHAPACDDLAGVAAALSAFDALGRSASSVRVLLTRAEEVGFVGAIGACASGVIPKKAIVVALECSKSDPNQSPLGAGSIVRVGDRTSTFDPRLTYRLGRVAQEIASNDKAFRWQRCLMPGGTCEATAYQAYGYTAACLCLPLGNYHNMNEATGRIAAETISLDDYHHLVRLLVRVGQALGHDTGAHALRDSLDGLFNHRRSLLAGKP